MSEVNRLLADRYLLKSLIGQGGMADVYLAEDQVLNRKVAVKILRSSLTGDPIYIKRFHREASAAAAINHKNIVSIYDVGDEDDLYYIVMEYVKGQTLKQLINIRGALHYIEAIDIMKQVVSAVATAHSMGIVHRDLKPQNILITDSGIVKITDFGIASIQSLSQVTQTNTIMGSLHYLAPEIARGEKATPQSDIYALGIVFYELLRGEVPFNGESPVNIALKHMRDEIPSVREFNSSIPQSVENIIIKATAKNPLNRYESALDMLQDINTCLDHPNEKKISFGAPASEPTIVAGNTEFFTQDKEDTAPAAKTADTEETARVTRTTPKVEKKKKKGKGKGKLIVIVIALAIVAAVIIGVMSSGILNKSKTYTMPNLVGMKKSAASSKLKEEELDGNVTYRTELSETYASGKVISTSPKSGTTIKKDTAITVTVSSGKWIIMKDYTGEKYSTAKSELEDLGYSVSRYEKTDDDFAAGEVIGQSVSSGEKVDPNSENKSITLTVSKGVSITVPYLYGDSISSATSTLKSLGFNVKTSVLKPSDDEASKVTESNLNTVIKQSIAPYTVVTKKGTTITLYYYDQVPQKKDDQSDENTSNTDASSNTDGSESSNGSGTSSSSSKKKSDSSSTSKASSNEGSDTSSSGNSDNAATNGASNTTTNSAETSSSSTSTNN